MRQIFSAFLISFLALVAVPPVSAQDGEGDSARYSIDLDPLFFNIIQRGRVRGRVQIDLTMELMDSRDFEDISERVPQLRSDILTALTTLARDRMSPNAPINPDVVVAFLQPVVDYRVGPDRVNLYVTNALITPK